MRMLLILLTAVLAFGQTPDFESSFTGQTLRWDYTHTGTAGEEHIGLDQVRLEGEWPGSRRQLIDDTNLGKYLFEVTDLASGALIYSRGFASIYGEWETIGEAQHPRITAFPGAPQAGSPDAEETGCRRPFPDLLQQRSRSRQPLRGPLQYRPQGPGLEGL